MAHNCALPPSPQHAVLKRIYPWDNYDIALLLQYLYKQAQKTGFAGTFEDFKQRYGSYMEMVDPADIHDFLENYTGAYKITPLVGIDQILHTKNKVLNEDIIVEQIPTDVISTTKKYQGQYHVTPRAYFSQILRTKETILEENVTVGEIPYATTTNSAGGYTAIIG